ncbi:glycosyltransferase family 32 protein [Mycena albidolilacea]|uniref:Glycosyltransferase family 32 protein n=1 Tax=Mycena albidolilacea TaxID=1033008 RepID=A0AAD6ZKY8_9AGAR|nr:glycosyltransferase family 32 protein [Mycena albidolilacea]
MPHCRRAMITATFFLAVFYLTTQSSTPTKLDPIPAAISKKGDKVIEEPLRKPLTTADLGRKMSDGSGGGPGAGGSRLGQNVLQDASLYDKLGHRYPYDVETDFPAYIWQTWKWTPADKKFEFRDSEAAWTELHPGFVHEVVADDAAARLLRLLYGSVPEVLKAYHALPLPVLKADFFRYLILLARGGVYSDIDTVPIQSAIEWIPDSVSHQTVGLVIGIEADPDRADWRDWYSRRIQFCQWTIQSKPGHPVLRRIVTRITEATLAKKKAGELKGVLDENFILEFTGPAVWTDIIFEHFNDPRYFEPDHPAGPIDWRNFTGMEMPRKVGDVAVLPITSFSPGVGHMGSKDASDPMAFVRHDFQGAWRPQKEW